MNKLLRFTMVAVLAIVANLSFAQTTVTFVAGTDKGTCSDSNNPIDDVVSKDGITISVTGSVLGRTDQYRIFKGKTITISSTVGNITKVVFTCSANGSAKYGPGNFTDATSGDYTFEENGKTGTWTGDAESFTMTASTNQVRATSIEVTYTPSSQGGETPETLDAPVISGNTPFLESTTVTITAAEGTEIYYTTDGQTPDDRAGQLYTAPFTLTESATVKAIAYKDALESPVASKDFNKQAPLTGEGTLANPYTATDAINLASSLDKDALTDSVYVKGIISEVKEVSVDYGNATYYISDNGETTNQFYIFRGKNLGKKNFTDASEISVGDEVVVYGVLTNYYGNTPEMVSGNYIVSTTHKDTPVEPTYTTAENFAAFKALESGVNAELTMTNAQVLYSWTSLNGNSSVYMRDASGALLVYNSGIELANNQVVNGTVILGRSEYKGTIQATKSDLTNAEALTITEGEQVEPKVITMAEAADNLSDYVELQDVNVVSETADDKTTYYAEKDGNRIQLYNGFHIDGLDELTIGEGQKVRGIVTLFNNNAQITITELPVVTAISNVTVNDAKNAVRYNLAGQRVGENYKGIVIENGKKVVRK